MPQYKMKQYGIKQYGAFRSKPGAGGTDSNIKWTFIRSRFGCVRKGRSFWLYMHKPATFIGQADKIRIRANSQEWIQEEKVQLKGPQTKVRLVSNKTTDWLISQQLE